MVGFTRLLVATIFASWVEKLAMVVRGTFMILLRVIVLLLVGVFMLVVIVAHIVRRCQIFLMPVLHRCLLVNYLLVSDGSDVFTVDLMMYWFRNDFVSVLIRVGVWVLKGAMHCTLSVLNRLNIMLLIVAMIKNMSTILIYSSVMLELIVSSHM